MSKENILTGMAIGILLVGLFVAATCTYVINEREQAVITRLNRPVRIIVGNLSGTDFATLEAEILSGTPAGVTEDIGIDLSTIDLSVSQGAGLYFKVPFVDSVERFPDVILEYDVAPRDIVLAYKKKLAVDNFAGWRIENPLLYRIRVRNESNARDRLGNIIYSVMLEQLGRSTLTEVIRTTNRFMDTAPGREGQEEDLVATNPMRERVQHGREEIMKAVTVRADEKARQYGIRVSDVRIKRADLVPENLQAVFGRMQAERSRISKGYRSEGNKEGNIIKGNTDRDVQVILAEAKRDAEIRRGEGDAEAAGVFAKAFGSNPEFYKYMRTLEVIREATPPGSEFVIGLDSSIYNLLQNP
jgi:membrane protease subunit HflC